MLEEILEIFTGMSTLVIIFFVAGFSLMLLEVIIPALGMFMFTGGVSVVGGIITRIIQGASFFQSVALIVMCIAVSFIFLFIYIRRLDAGKEKSALVQNGVVVTNYSNPLEEFGHLIGFIGSTTSECRPFGKAKIEGEKYEVVSNDGTFIPKGSDVEVVDVDYDHIFVRVLK